MDPEVGFEGPGADLGDTVLSSSLSLPSLDLSDTKVFELHIRALLGTASHFCKLFVLKLYLGDAVGIDPGHQFLKPYPGSYISPSILEYEDISKYTSIRRPSILAYEDISSQKLVSQCKSANHFCEIREYDDPDLSETDSTLLTAP